MFPFFLLLIPIVFYFLPALLPIWRTFLIVWGGLGFMILLLWIEPGFLPKSTDPLAVMIDAALRKSLTAMWVAAGFVQGVRGVVYSKGYNDQYPHWFTVLAGALALFLTFVSVW